jgi:hypothetical protein
VKKDRGREDFSFASLRSPLRWMDALWEGGLLGFDADAGLGPLTNDLMLDNHCKKIP